MLPYLGGVFSDQLGVKRVIVDAAPQRSARAKFHEHKELGLLELDTVALDEMHALQAANNVPLFLDGGVDCLSLFGVH